MKILSEYQLRQEIVRVTRIVANQGLIRSSDGNISAGRTLEDALIGLERLEHAAYTFHLAKVLGEPISLPDDELTHLRVIDNCLTA